MAKSATHQMRTAPAGMRPPDGPQSQRALAALARDAALARIGRVRVLMLVGAVVLTAILAALASALLPGKSLGATGHVTARTGARSTTSGPTSRVTSSVAPRMPAPAGPAALGLQGPAQAPQSTAPPASTQASPPPATTPVQPAPAAPSGGGAVVSGGS